MHIIIFIIVGFFLLHGIGTKLKERQEKDARGELTELDKAPGKLFRWGIMAMLMIAAILSLGPILQSFEFFR
jgi:uncharacterized membrane protein